MTPPEPRIPPTHSPQSDDLAAYKRMRDRGLRPPRIAGCAELEATATRESLSWGQGLTETQMQTAREGMAEALALFG